VTFSPPKFEAASSTTSTVWTASLIYSSTTSISTISLNGLLLDLGIVDGHVYRDHLSACRDGAASAWYKVPMVRKRAQQARLLAIHLKSSLGTFYSGSSAPGARLISISDKGEGMLNVEENKKIYALAVALFALSLGSVYIVLDDLKFDINYAVLGRSTLPAVTVGFFLYQLVSRFLWRYRPMQFLLGIKIPYIEGTWEGHIESAYDDHRVQRPVTIIIKQTLNYVHMHYQDENATSNSILAGIRSNDSGENKLYCLYCNSPLKTNMKNFHPHNGVMELYIDSPNQRMHGIYYNNQHQRKTFGNLWVEKF